MPTETKLFLIAEIHAYGEKIDNETIHHYHHPHSSGIRVRFWFTSGPQSPLPLIMPLPGREKEREGEREGNGSPLPRPQLETWPTTQACAMTSDLTHDLLVGKLSRLLLS